MPGGPGASDCTPMALNIRFVTLYDTQRFYEDLLNTLLRTSRP